MMSQIISQDDSTFDPTFKNQVLRKIELTSNALLDFVIREIAEQLG